MPVAHIGAPWKTRLKVNGKWLEGKELEDYIGERDKEYWAMVKSELDGANCKRP